MGAPRVEARTWCPHQDALNRPGFLEGPFVERMEPMARPSRYSPEVRERAVRLVREHEAATGSQSAIRSMTEKLGCTAETLRRWVRPTERDARVRPGSTPV